MTSTSKGPVSLLNLTEDQIQYRLDHQLDEYYPAVAFLALIALMGVVGNSLILLVYHRKASRYATDVFIMAIAIYDLLTNVVATPVTLTQIFIQIDSDFAQCQLQLYLNGLITMPSILFLLAVSVCRYKMICKPFGKQISKKTAKIYCILIPIASAICLLPIFLLFDTLTQPTEIPGINTKICTVEHNIRKSIFPLLYLVLVVEWFLFTLLALITRYVLIFNQAWKRSKNKHGTMAKPTTSEATGKILTRTTRMMITVSGVYLISILPIVLILTCELATPKFQENMTAGGHAAYHIFIRSYFINSGVNVIIYSVWDVRFREGVKRIFGLQAGYTPESGISSRQRSRITKENTCSSSGMFPGTNRAENSSTDV